MTPQAKVYSLTKGNVLKKSLKLYEKKVQRLKITIYFTQIPIRNVISRPTEHEPIILRQGDPLLHRHSLMGIAGYVSVCVQLYCMLVSTVFHYMFRPAWPSSSA
jgi:hypothetical protein